MLKKYRMGFDLWALILFAAIMLPNIIWAALPAPNDILRTPSVTPVIDAAGSACQVLMIAALCMLRRSDCPPEHPPVLPIAVGLCTALYYLSWVLYYCGITGAAVVLGLTVPPCLAFILFALYRKNFIAAAFAAGFTVCHLIFALVNFIL